MKVLWEFGVLGSQAARLMNRAAMPPLAARALTPVTLLGTDQTKAEVFRSPFTLVVCCHTKHVKHVEKPEFGQLDSFI